MGARQSATGTTPRTHGARFSTSTRHSIDATLDNPSGSRRIGGLFRHSTTSGLSTTPPEHGSVGSVVGSRRRRGRAPNDVLVEAHSLPASLFPSFFAADIKCPVCNKRVASDEIETHLLACLSKPKVSYNENTLKSDSGECIICFEDMCKGERIARLPCLCIYHKKCLDEWFQRNRCCPEHPDQLPQEFTSETNSISSGEPFGGDDTFSPLMDNQRSNSPENSQMQSVDDTPTRDTFENERGASAANRGDATVDDNCFNPENCDGFNVEIDTGNMNREEENIFALPLTDNEVEGSAGINQPSSLEPRLLSSPDLYGTHRLGNAVHNCLHTNNRFAPNNLTLPNKADDESVNQAENWIPFETSDQTVVHVDDGVYGSPSLTLDDDEIAQLASKIKTILVAESPREIDNQVDGANI